MAKTKPGNALAKLVPSTDEMRAELTARHSLLIDQANHGDPEATRTLQRLLQMIEDEAPDLLKAFTGFQETVEAAFLDLLVPRREGQLFTRDLRERQIKRLRADLLGPHPTLRRLLIPTVQVNVAKHQVNVASAAVVSASP